MSDAKPGRSQLADPHVLLLITLAKIPTLLEAHQQLRTVFIVCLVSFSLPPVFFVPICHFWSS